MMPFSGKGSHSRKSSSKVAPGPPGCDVIQKDDIENSIPTVKTINTESRDDPPTISTDVTISSKSLLHSNISIARSFHVHYPNP